MRDFVSWNVSSWRKQFSRADAIFVSFPKSGRTWVRVFYQAYLSKLSGQDFSLTRSIEGHPRLVFTHDRWEHRMLPGWWNFVRGKRLIPTAPRRSKKIVLMVRDPRDVVVSLHYHLAKRPNVFRWPRQTIGQMLRDPRFGIEHVVELMNAWLAEWGGREDFLLLRYVDCRTDPRGTFAGLLDFLGFGSVDEEAFEHALEFSSFENMRAMEASGGFKEGQLSAGNSADGDSFKARSGRVGGFRDHFTEEDLAFAANAMRKLNPRFGYVAEPESRREGGASRNPNQAPNPISRVALVEPS